MDGVQRYDTNFALSIHVIVSWSPPSDANPPYQTEQQLGKVEESSRRFWAGVGRAKLWLSKMGEYTAGPTICDSGSLTAEHLLQRPLLEEPCTVVRISPCITTWRKKFDLWTRKEKKKKNQWYDMEHTLINPYSRGRLAYRWPQSFNNFLANVFTPHCLDQTGLPSPGDNHPLTGPTVLTPPQSDDFLKRIFGESRRG